jgi:hypothetical protein
LRKRFYNGLIVDLPAGQCPGPLRAAGALDFALALQVE